MSLTLGEKLRQAREERGISVSEVAEQTRISPLYITSIENNDYKPLPGGIFNKGFVKSYAKFVGLDEQEALQEYSRLVASTETEVPEQPRSYRPEVLTDDRPGGSMLPTVLFAGVILALMTAGILFIVRYLQSDGTPQTAANVQSGPAANEQQTPAEPSTPGVAAPALETAKIEFRAAGQDVWLRSVVDGKGSEALVKANESVTYSPKESLKLSYSRSRANFAQLSINGKTVDLPTEPTTPSRGTIDVEITRDNFDEIWQSGKIGGTLSSPARESTSQGRPARPRPSPSPAATQPRPSPMAARPAATPRTAPRTAPRATP